MNKIFGIVGWSGSGKTDLICRLINAFKKFAAEVRSGTFPSKKHSISVELSSEQRPHHHWSPLGDRPKVRGTPCVLR